MTLGRRCPDCARSAELPLDRPDGSSDVVAAAAHRFDQRRLFRVVLDLVSNPGGTWTSIIRVARSFLAIAQPALGGVLHGRIRGGAGRQFSPYRKSLPHLRSGQDIPGFLPIGARIISSAIRRRNVSHRQEHLLTDGRRCVYRVTSLEGTDS